VEVAVLKWALIFFVVSIIAGVFGFTGISAATAGIARILFGLFLVIFVVLLVLALLAGELSFEWMSRHRCVSLWNRTQTIRLQRQPPRIQQRGPMGRALTLQAHWSSSV